MSSVAQLSPDLAALNLPAKISAFFENPFPGNMATAGLQQQQIGGSEFASLQGHFLWTEPFKKQPVRKGNLSGILSHSHDVGRASATQLSADMVSIKAEYVLRNEAAIVNFFSIHRMAFPFLSKALPELKKSFGDNVVFNLEALTEDDDVSTLYAIAIWRGPAEQADAALEDFDEHWW